MREDANIGWQPGPCVWGAAGLTLYEMTTGTLPAPIPQDGLPQRLAGELAIDEQRFDPAIRDALAAFFRQHPEQAERDYLRAIFDKLLRYPAMGELLLDPVHNPLWQLPVSSDGAKQLIEFFQRIAPESGELLFDFTDPGWDTRFLGDLYQDLSEAVRKRYVLLQTPEFVESFVVSTQTGTVSDENYTRVKLLMFREKMKHYAVHRLLLPPDSE